MFSTPEKPWFTSHLCQTSCKKSWCYCRFNLNVNKQISPVKSSFNQLQTMAKLKSVLSYNNLENIIHAFITSHLNSLCFSLPLTLVVQLQLVQNAAARLLTNTKKMCAGPIRASHTGFHWVASKSPRSTCQGLLHVPCFRLDKKVTKRCWPQLWNITYHQTLEKLPIEI